MNKKINAILASLFLVILLRPLALADETLTVTTYYPSPYGSYRQLEVNEAGESVTQTDFTQGLTYAGLIITTEYTADAYTPGVFWKTSNNNSTKPKAGIYLRETGTGTRMYFGTSNVYATGITNDAIIINEGGRVGINSSGFSNSARLEIVGGVDSVGLRAIYGRADNASVAAIYGDARGASGVGVLGDGMSASAEGVRGTNFFANNSGYGVRAWNTSANVASWGLYCNTGHANGCGGNVAWNNASDARLKENIEGIHDALAKVLKLRGVTFNWRSNPSVSDMGFVAQEAASVVPEIIGKDPNDMYTMRTSQITALLVEAIKEQQKQIGLLNASLDQLKRDNQALAQQLVSSKGNKK